MRISSFNLAVAVSLSTLCGPLFAQSASQESETGASEQSRGDKPASPPVTSSTSLDELIPQSAVDDPESWATKGVPSSEDALDSVPVEPVDETVLTQSPPAEESFDVETALEAIAQSSPVTPLPPEDDRPDFTAIPLPETAQLPQLAISEISDNLVLAFPLDEEAFPERGEFIERYRALSSILALDSGEDSVPQLAARARSDAELLGELLRNYGYYDGEVMRQLSGGRRGDSQEGESDSAGRVTDQIDLDPKVRFDVLPGSLYRFGAVDLGALNQIDQADASHLTSRFGIVTGDPLYADEIVSGAAQLQAGLGESGYPFASLGKPDLLIDHQQLSGDLSLPVEPGGRFVFGDVVSGDPEFLSSEHLQRIARFKTGQTYQTSLQNDLRRAVLATGLVSSVTITPREQSAPEDGQEGQVALDIDLERAPLRTISAAIGYGTQDGVKLEAGWEHRNFFPPEGALKLRGIIGTREQLASVSFRRSNFRARDQILNLDIYASDIETEAVEARTLAFRGSFEKVSNLLFQKPLSWQVGAEFLYTDERNVSETGVADPRQTYRIAGLFGSATIDSTDDLLDPAKGYRLTAFLAPEISQTEGAESFYLRNQFDGSAYHDIGSAVIAGRVRAASIQGTDTDKIAPSRRLYAGGGGSVRGYGFQAIGPRDDSGEPMGGGSLVEAAIEARIQTGLLDGAVEIVPFFDAGSVADGPTPDFSQIQYGAGLGVRYKTTFGPIRVDVGVPLNPTEFDAPVVVYVSLGQAF